MGPKELALRRAQEYSAFHGLILSDEIGHGMNGVVFMADAQNDFPGRPRLSAVKACHSELEYVRERDVYFRLQELEIKKIRSCRIPQLVEYNDDLWIIEMTIVTRPFCLDFGGAFLEPPPDFSEEVMADWQAEKIEQFGKHWPEVQQILAVLEAHGIYLMDVHPKNISFSD
jgi:hypothetical protein